MLDTPVLFLVFNRPEKTKRVFSVVRRMKPKYLFIAADGPRNNKVGEDRKCEEVRQIVTNIDWECEIKTLFRDNNLGCGKAVSSAIDWFFENIEEGIILEDDCLPDDSFFYFCEKLLEYHRLDNKVMIISGNNFQDDKIYTNTSYYFSSYPHIWGWATWKRAWKLFDFEMEGLDDFINENKLKQNFRRKRDRICWKNILKQTQKNNIDTWDYRWMYAIWKNRGVCIIPNCNLVKNIGFDEEATHTKSNNNYPTTVASIKEIKFNNNIKLEYNADERYFDYFLKRKSNLRAKLRRNIKKVIPPILLELLVSKKYDFLKKIPRFTEVEVDLLGKKIKIPDTASFRFIYDELFEKEIYKFKATTLAPRIIDAGANIGLSAIYFKQLYPNAKIIAFEPDAKIFEYLKYNVYEVFGYKNVELVRKGLWNKETTLAFYEEGADGGRITDKSVGTTYIEVTRLRSYINEKTEFLKIDIEGAEYKVLEDCKDLLKNVENLFVEYHSFKNEQQRLGELLMILSNAGFRYIIHHIGVFSANPFIHIRNYANMDLQMNIYAFRG